MDTEGAVAIVGVACRYPGCETLDEFWRILVNGENHIKEVTPDRWSVEAFYDPNFETPGKTYAKWAGLIDNAFEWDNTPFNVNELEAEVMDPQQKLALEVSFKALENAGIPLQQIKGSNTAVYMCQMNADYANQSATDISSWRNYEFTGTSPSILANRVSYTFDLRGASVSLDTACSGSMVAVHLGARSILNGESTIALCGGSNFILGPSTFIALSKSRMASPTGQCRAFSADADGYVKAEGCGVIVLKDLKKAIAEKDRIWGIIKTSISSDGHAESPITNPSKIQLKHLITDVCLKAKVEPEIIQYVECHGTGTSAGDPTEAWGIGTVIGQKRKSAGLSPVPIGSVKTNIGHLESAAGTAGLLKVLLMMKHGKLVPSLHCQVLNPKIDFEGLHVTVNRSVGDMGFADNKNQIRIVSLNSNGFGGTAVHSIVQQNQSMVQPNLPQTEEFVLPFLFSATSQKALKMTIQDTISALSEGYIPSLYQLSYTSTLKRTYFPVRTAVYAKTKEELLQTLQKMMQKTKVGHKVTEGSCNMIFVFCGMGSHWKNMGKNLYSEDDVFKSTIDSIQRQLDLLDSKISVVACFEGHHDLSDPLFGQPAIFSVQVGIYEMFRARQMTPNVILGHSVGEVAASFCAGVLSLEQAVRLIYYRGKALQKATGGGMLVIGKLGVEKVKQVMMDLQCPLEVAAENSPTSCTLSGDIGAINRMEGEISKQYGDGIFMRKLDVKVAYHSKYMDNVLSELGSNLKSLSPQTQAKIKLISTVTGKAISAPEMCSAKYWQQNLRKGVSFSQAFTQALLENSHNLIVEIGPKPVLRSNIKELASGVQYTHLASMTENCETEHVLQTLNACLEVQPRESWQKYYTKPCVTGDFPRYIFLRKYLFKEPENAKLWRQGLVSQKYGYSRGAKDMEHPFVTNREMVSDGVNRFTLNFTPETTPFIFEHKIENRIIVPGGTYPEIAIAAVSNSQGALLSGTFSLDVSFIRPLMVANEEEKKEAVVTVFTKCENNRTLHEFDVTTGEILHASGVLAVQPMKVGDLNTLQFPINSLKSRCTETFNQDQLYQALSELSFTYGKSLRWGKTGYKNTKEILLELQPAGDLSETTLHPVFIDSLFQLFSLFATASRERQMIPQSLGELMLLECQEKIRWAYVKVVKQSTTHFKFDGYLLSDLGKVVAVCRDMTVSEIINEKPIVPVSHMFQMRWKTMEELPKVAAMNKGAMNIALFTDNQKDLEEEILKWQNCSIHKVQKPQVTSKSVTQNDMMSLLSFDFAKLDCVIYGWSLKSNLSHQDDGLSMSKKVGAVCMDIINVLKSMQSMSTAVPIYILTHGFVGLQEENKTPNEHGIQGCLAAAVLSMMRTITWEFPLQEYHVIDIDKIVHLSMLHEAIGNASSMPAEIALNDKGMQINQFMPFPESTETKPRCLVVPSKTHFSLTRKKTKDVQYEIKLQETREVSKKVLQDDQILVKLDRVYIDNTRKCPMVSHVISYDAIAHDQAGNKHVIFWPCKTTNQMLPVPKLHCVPLRTFPTDMPTLSYWVIAWNICSASLLDETAWSIIGSFDDNPICETVRLLAKFMTRANETEMSMAKTVILFCTDPDKFCFFQEQAKSCKQLYVIATESKVCEVIKTMISESQSAKFIMSLDEIVSTSLNFSMKPFTAWLLEQNRGDLSKIVKYFNNKLKEVSCKLNVSALDELQAHSFVILEVHQESPVRVTATDNSLFRNDASYLVVGGSKGLGFELVQYMALQGAGRIGIMSRNGIPHENQMVLEDLKKETKCEFLDAKADATDAKDLKKTFEAFRSSGFPLKGVFFGAVVLHDASVTNMTEDILYRVLNPKIVGAWNTFMLCRNLHLDYLVFHSSVVSMCGNVGQSNYAAANGFLDGLAMYSRKLIGTGQAICWGALDVGLLENNKITKRKLAAHGMMLLSKADFKSCFNHALLYNPCVAAYSRFNYVVLTKEVRKLPSATQKMYWWIRFRKGHYVKESVFTKDMMTGGSQEYLKKLFQAITMIEEEDIDPTIPLEQLGVDSHQLTTIYSNLIKDFGQLPGLSVVEMPVKTLSEISLLMDNCVNDKGNSPAEGDVHVNQKSQSHMQFSESGVINPSNEKVQQANNTPPAAPTRQQGPGGLVDPDSEQYETEPKPLSLDQMKQGSEFRLPPSFIKINVYVDNQKDTTLIMKGESINLSFNIRNLKAATTKDKIDAYYGLQLEWKNTEVLTIYSDTEIQSKQWKEGLMNLNTAAESSVKSSTCNIL